MSKPEGKTPLRRFRQRRDESIERVVKQMDYRARCGSSGSGQGHVAGCCEHGAELRFTYNAGKLLTVSKIISFSKMTSLMGLSLTFYAPCISLQYVYKPTRCTQLQYIYIPTGYTM